MDGFLLEFRWIVRCWSRHSDPLSEDSSSPTLECPSYWGKPIFDLVVGIEASDHFEGHRLLFEDALHGVFAGPPAEADVADSGYFSQAQARVLRLEVDDEAPYGGRQLPVSGRLRVEETLHPLGLEAVHPTVKRSLRGFDLYDALGH